MSVIVRDDGFHPDDWHGVSLDLAPDTCLSTIEDRLAGIGMVIVEFPAFSDGRGFTIARRLRALGYVGRLRARGHVLADQYAMARRSGFDEVEISDDLAARQDAAQWRFRADWQAHDYQSRLRA
ncbi:DUF934 domain-containing protein [Frigidibacter oleivorans]|uniref:DUF934 domain-containing protein n=1 Tax=Frigidibacter oleivorans TaxID=2487129 RepID=UPI000F8C8C0A|nr:DUF934 domain-containing protein [Frigidibacter oleivorans]